MASVLRCRSLSLEDISNESFSSTLTEERSPNTRIRRTFKKCNSVDGSKRSKSTSGSYIIDYGPIRIRHRRTVSQTLATGRRSKYEPISGEDALKREIRRAKNRLAARDLKKARDQVEANLIQTIKELENEKKYLEDQHKKLEEQKAHLNRAVYNAKQAPLIPFITDIDMPILFELQERGDCLVDLQPLLQSIHEHCCLSEL